MGDEIKSAARTSEVIQGKQVFRRMAKGRGGYSPEYFDHKMAELGLTPAHIGETAETIIAAKRRWRALWVKEVFRLMAAGLPGYNPDYFDETMVKLGLTPADIDQTAETIAAAKRRWNMTRGPSSAIDPEKLAGPDLEALEFVPDGEVHRAHGDSPDAANG